MLKILFTALIFAISDFGQSVPSSRVQPSVSIMAEIENSCPQAGKGLLIKVKLTNVSGMELAIPRDVSGKAELDYHVLVTNIAGEPVELTQYHHALRGERDDSGVYFMTTRSRALRLLKPSQSITDTIDVSQLFKISRTGNYTVVISFEDPTTKELVSSSQLRLSVKC